MTDLASPPASAGQTRMHMIEAARQLLEGSPTNDISTRAVCQAVGMGRPVLYRLFGDKNGLLRAVVDDGYNRYRTQALSRAHHGPRGGPPRLLGRPQPSPLPTRRCATSCSPPPYAPFLMPQDGSSSCSPRHWTAAPSPARRASPATRLCR